MLKAIPRSSLLALAATALLLGGCAEVSLLSYGAKKLNSRGSSSPEITNASISDIDRGAPKLGSPYQVNGIWYYPKADPTYSETGIASWYGEPFHGRKTANGATYNMYHMTAAHKTLPLPTDVRVTNLENGRSVIVTVNDRGPFAHSRIIDLSYRAAQLLDMVQKGTAKVRVEVINSDGFGDTRIAAKPETPESERNNVAAAPRAEVQSASLAPPSGAKIAAAPRVETLPAPAPTPAPAAADVAAASAPAGEQQLVSLQPVGSSEIFIQAGAFIDYNNANILSARLSSLGPTKVSQVLVNGQDFYRVRVGPVGDINEADRVLSSLIDTGHHDARIIIE